MNMRLYDLKKDLKVGLRPHTRSTTRMLVHTNPGVAVVRLSVSSS